MIKKFLQNHTLGPYQLPLKPQVSRVKWTCQSDGLEPTKINTD